MRKISTRQQAVARRTSCENKERRCGARTEASADGWSRSIYRTCVLRYGKCNHGFFRRFGRACLPYRCALSISCPRAASRSRPSSPGARLRHPVDSKGRTPHKDTYILAGVSSGGGDTQKCDSAVLSDPPQPRAKTPPRAHDSPPGQAGPYTAAVVWPLSHLGTPKMPECPAPSFVLPAAGVPARFFSARR